VIFLIILQIKNELSSLNIFIPSLLSTRFLLKYISLYIMILNKPHMNLFSISAAAVITLIKPGQRNTDVKEIA